MLVMENRRRELADATAVKVVKGLLFSEETSSITSLENIVKDTVQFNVVEQEIIDREYIPKEVKPFFDKKEHSCTEFLPLVIKKRCYLRI